MSDWRGLAATGLGLGHSPFAPGTAGSGGALVLVWVIMTYGGAQGGYALLAIAILLYPAGRSLAEWAEQEWGDDPGCFVLDEIAGYLLGAAIIWLATASSPDVTELVALFVLFRAFDILKPWPISRLEEFKGGDGVMLDDVAAGILAAVVLLLLPILF
ncbi:MAG: phosphatidylglycerophosphatase A [Candidatus Poseidoniia archaeon]|nr:phosphatidylglycerophosphatase A [Candidatus Poseidoniia archaeon]MDP7081746.1 phosphatidylglycerophosphatase A [Candidatus Poseidoniia archaeon]MDP7255936.1 phosphatidylglycerophosphatase A [Candidatus Poseidoniia archaeon]MDP7473926.1 phosphatidylglycerophosphatase A [Candidatus Poseidoniia archaeon]MDP7538166.1 phosphatidylglycerophosphatase A [Candidatus Poseidoniia archaeon]